MKEILFGLASRCVFGVIVGGVCGLVPFFIAKKKKKRKKFAIRSLLGCVAFGAGVALLSDLPPLIAVIPAGVLSVILVDNRKRK